VCAQQTGQKVRKKEFNQNKLLYALVFQQFWCDNSLATGQYRKQKYFFSILPKNEPKTFALLGRFFGRNENKFLLSKFPEL
jgi:hypothetical protein